MSSEIVTVIVPRSVLFVSIPAPLTLKYVESLGAASTAVPSAVSNKITSSSNMPLSPSTFDAKFNCALIAEFEWFVTVISLGSSHQHADSVV